MERAPVEDDEPSVDPFTSKGQRVLPRDARDVDRAVGDAQRQIDAPGLAHIKFDLVEVAQR